VPLRLWTPTAIIPAIATRAKAIAGAMQQDWYASSYAQPPVSVQYSTPSDVFNESMAVQVMRVMVFFNNFMIETLYLIGMCVDHHSGVSTIIR